MRCWPTRRSRRWTSQPARHARTALVTWDVTAAGLMPVGRTQAEVVMAGLEPMLEGRLDPDARILSSLCLGSIAGIAPR